MNLALRVVTLEKSGITNEFNEICLLASLMSVQNVVPVEKVYNCANFDHQVAAK